MNSNRSDALSLANGALLISFVVGVAVTVLSMVTHSSWLAVLGAFIVVGTGLTYLRRRRSGTTGSGPN